MGRGQGLSANEVLYGELLDAAAISRDAKSTEGLQCWTFNIVGLQPGDPIKVFNPKNSAHEQVGECVGRYKNPKGSYAVFNVKIGDEKLICRASNLQTLRTIEEGDLVETPDGAGTFQYAFGDGADAVYVIALEQRDGENSIYRRDQLSMYGG